jgi:hypothetical protein
MLDDSLDLVCPRCGLSIRPRAPWLTVEHCPRCIAYARIPVRMSTSAGAPARSGGAARRRHGSPPGAD